MRLKRLELYGYKSFATRTVFEFGEGITAVVGPNGSGKSNVADAIRWVLGEQSYRTLRAKSTEDMIFAGSRQRSRLGMAEVLITLDNSTGWLPIAYTEVPIGRRAYRSGENEYLLNGNRVRYRDVLDLLGGAGLGRNAYMVIGQGMVDAALALRPEARRELFEEAAGISPHLRKREESVARIAETERNLERVNDILNEIRPRAAGLRRQAERAEEYLLLSQDLKELQRIWYGHQWQRRQQQLARAEEQVRDQMTYLEGQRAHAQAAQERVAQAAEQQAAKRRAIEALRGEQAAQRDLVETLRREAAVNAERGRLYQRQREALEAELQSLASRRQILTDEIASATAELAGQEASYSESQAELQAARQRLGQVDAARRSLETQASQTQTRLNQLAAALSAHRARLEQLGERRAEGAAEAQRSEEALAALAERARDLAGRGERLAEQARALAESRREAAERRATLENQLTAAREELAAAEKSAAQLRAEHDRLTARYELLGRLRQELTGYNPGVREALSQEAKLSGLLGTAASLMNTPQELEQAIESALGARLQNIIAERWEDAERAIEHLKRTQAGWATFLPLDAVRSRPPLNVRPEAGVVGVASALVRYEERLRPAFEMLLGHTLIVRDLPTARRMLDRYPGASLIVTLAGETVQPSGALSGGARRNASHLLAQEREWRELPPRIAAAEGNLAEALQAYAAQQAQIGDLQRQLQEMDRQANRLRAEADAAQSAVGQHAQEMREVERERKWREERLAATRQELAQLDDRERRQREGLAAAEHEQAEALARLNALRDQLSAADDEALRQKTAELETRAAVAQRTARSQQALIASHRSNLAQLETQISEKRAQVEALTRDLAQLAEGNASNQSRLAEIEAAAAALRDRAEPLRQELARLEREQQTVERQRAQSLERLNEAELAVNRATLERDRVKEQQAALAQEIELELGPIDLPETISHQLRLSLGDDVVELPAVETLPPGLGEEIAQMKARLRRLGHVNTDAPQEYEQLLERQTFLQSQAADLRGAIATLHEVIQELDAIIERDFAATFDTVNKAFTEYFAVLFNGGAARLVLTDPDNLSATGVDIIAHPPGKRAQNLSLLSGGERSLTAVALLFALLRANPVPFSFLDEVDAALDEANVGRFRDLLQQHARETQFVVITHNRNTIEAAGTIYGISMGEQGVSQSISLKLDGQGQPGEAAS